MTNLSIQPVQSGDDDYLSIPSTAMKKRKYNTKRRKARCEICRRLISITVILPILVVCLVVATSGVVFALTYSNSVRAVDSLSKSLTAEISANIRGTVDNLFAEPPKVLRMMSMAGSLGHIFVSNVSGMEWSDENYDNLKRYGLQLLDIFPDFAVVYVSNDWGDITGVEKTDEGKFVEWSKRSYGNTTWHLQTTSETTLTEYCELHGGEDNLYFYHIKEDGTRDPTEPFSYNCGWTAQIRPWYFNALADNVTWSEVYIFGDGALGISASLQILTPEGLFLGVAGVDYKLNTLNVFLQRIEVGSTGVAFLMNHDGEFLASSDPNSAIDQTGDTDSFLGEIIPAVDVPDRMVSQAAAHLINRFGEDFPSTFARGNIEFKAKAGDRGCFIQAANMDIADTLQWMVVVVLPEADVLSDIWTGNIIMISTTSFSVLISVFAALLITFLIIYPLFRLGRYMNRVAKMDFNFTHKSSLFYEIRKIQSHFAAMTIALQYVNRFVPTTIIKEILSDEDADFQLKQVDDMTIVFCDIVKFTDMCSFLRPKELLYVMEFSMEELSKCVTESHGVIDKFIGDALMCLFNSPVSKLENHASYAIEASIACHKKLEDLATQNHWKRFKIEPIRCRVGIHSGSSLVGVFGSSQRLSYTSLGDSTNLAARLEPLCSAYGVGTLISADTFERAEEHYICRCLDLIVVKGRSELTPIFSPFCKIDEASEVQIQVQNASISMLNALQNGNRGAAIAAVAAILKLPGFTDDVAYRKMEARLKNAKSSLFHKYNVKTVQAAGQDATPQAQADSFSESESTVSSV